MGTVVNEATKPTSGLDADVPKFATSFVKWDGWNYRVWSASMLSALRSGGGEDYAGYVIGTKKKPTSGDSAKWTQQDAFVRSYLIYHMRPDLASRLKSIPTAVGIWTSVRQMHLKGVNFQIFELKKKIQEHKQEGMTVTQYYVMLCCMYQELDVYYQEMNKDFDFLLHPVLREIEDKDRLYQFLMGLNGVYKKKTREILFQDPLPSLEQAFQLVNQESNRQNPASGFTPACNPYSFPAHPWFPHGHPNSFPAHPWFPQGHIINCDYCGELYHTRETCWKLHVKPHGPAVSQGWSINCDYCGDLYHTREDCWKPDIRPSGPVVPHGHNVKCDCCGEFYHTRETCPKLHIKPPGPVDKGANVNGATAEGKDTKKALKPVIGRMVRKDPAKPKRPTSAFFVFMEEFRAAFKKEYPNNKSVAAVGSAGGKKWKSMSEAEKAPYQAKADKRKSNYENDLRSYNKKLSGEALEETYMSTSKVDKENGEDDEEEYGDQEKDYSSTEEEDEGTFVKIDMKGANGNGAKAEGKDTKKALKPVNGRLVGNFIKDPSKPKRPASAFFVFMEEFRVAFKKEYPHNKCVSVVGKAGGDKWKSMSSAEKAPYQAEAEKRKAEYERHLNSYFKKPEDDYYSSWAESEDYSLTEEEDEKSKGRFVKMVKYHDSEEEEEEEEEDDYSDFGSIY